MDDHCKLRSLDKGKIIEDKKFSLNPAKEEKIKRKLSAIHKEIGNLNYRRKLAQNQSVKAKKKIHNQISQIVKRLRAREHILLSNVDEVHASFDANISEELLKLQSVHSHCQALFTNYSNFGGNAGIISNITSTLAEVNCREKSDFMPLTFVSDFEDMKTRADTYGNLDGDFVKGGLVMNENGFYDSRDSVVKKECVDQGRSSNTNPGISCCLEKSSSEDSDIEETFQIINLIDDMHCIELEDFVMDEEGAENSKQLKNKLDEEVYKRESKVAKIYDNTEKSQIVNAKNINFNPDEEWKHLQELNKKLAEFKVTASKYNDFVERYPCNKEKMHVLQEANNLQFHKNSQNDVPRKEKSAKNINAAVNIVSPADLIKKSFQSYQVKGDIKYWLASN